MQKSTASCYLYMRGGSWYSCRMKEFIVNQNDAGQRLDRFITKAAPLLPSSLAQKYIRLKRIKANGKPVKREYKLVCGDVIHMYINDEFFDTSGSDEKNAYLKINDPSLDIVYEDENILLINKPAGVLCHSDGTYDYGTVVSRLQAYLAQKGEWRPRDENSFTPALCNRIDRNTSGLVIAAKNAEALRIMNDKIKQREIDKYYLAIVHGVLKPAEGRLDANIFKDSVKNQVYVSETSSPGSKTASMEYKTLAVTGVLSAAAAARSSSVATRPLNATHSPTIATAHSPAAAHTATGSLSLLECRLITGRTHQIRAQLVDAGHPLLGDGKYGSERLNKPFGEKHQALCSYKLVFAFQTNAGALSYLSGKTFRIWDVPFAQKYFGGINLNA